MSTATANLVDNRSKLELSQELLLRSVIDLEFRDQLLNDPCLFIDSETVEKSTILNTKNKLQENGVDTLLSELPTSVQPQDMSFVELVKESTDVNACTNTCISGFTIVCDGQTMGGGGGGPSCRSTCITGYTIRCDGNTL